MKAGRLRSFNADEAIDNAMMVFWKNGYPGTSISDLTEAMGINKSSLYTTFGNKEKLFISALKRYLQQFGMIHAEHLHISHATVSERIQEFLLSVTKMTTNRELPGGCLVCNSTCEMGGGNLPAESMHTVSEINKLVKSTFVDFFKNEIAAGNLKSSKSPEVLANYLMTIQFGLGVMSRNGAGLEELEEMINQSIFMF